MSDGPLLRQAVATDAAAIAEVYLRSFDAALPSVRRAHSDDEVRSWVRDVLVPGGGVFVADINADVVGLLALSDGWIKLLYVDPQWQRCGIGTQLISMAKLRAPSGLLLWTFQVNRPAQRFYERHGFVAVEWTDGSGNEELEPDVRYAWPAEDPDPR